MSLFDRQGTGFFSRFGIGAQVALSAVLALAAVLLINWLSARPGVRLRFDLTETGRNTLATATRGLLAQLEAPIRIEILYQPQDPPLTNVVAELMTRTQSLLALLEDESSERIDVEVADLNDRESWKTRALELELQGFANGLLVSSGERRTFVPLLGRLAQVNRGDPARGIAPSIAAFTAEEAIVEAILDVTRGDRLHAYFTFGYGEVDVKDSEDLYGAGHLGEALEREGFSVHRWNPIEDGPLPADCDVLGILAPTQSWPEAMRAEIEAYLDRGGRAIVAAATEADELRRSDVGELLEARGLQVSEGTLMVFAVEQATGKPYDNSQSCQNITVSAATMAPHPMLVPFIGAGRGFAVVRSHQVRVERQPDNGVAQVIAWAPRVGPLGNWLDATPLDYRLDPAVEAYNLERAGLVATVQLAPRAEVATPAGLEAELETRLVVFGTSTLFMNAAADANSDIWRASFNWVTDRQHRVNVAPRDPDLRFLPRDKPDAAVGVVRLAQIWLPLAGLVIGALTAFLRSRGGPSSRPRRAAEGASSHAGRSV